MIKTRVSLPESLSAITRYTDVSARIDVTSRLVCMIVMVFDDGVCASAFRLGAWKKRFDRRHCSSRALCRPFSPDLATIYLAESNDFPLGMPGIVIALKPYYI